MHLLVVDGANVVGSRPDGWWRDRPGAARRLWERLSVADLPYDVLLVLEGRARSGVPEDPSRSHPRDAVAVLHARGEGDDAIVEAARDGVAEGRDVTVVTADRGLRGRVEALGADVVGPSWLIDRLDGASG